MATTLRPSGWPSQAEVIASAMATSLLGSVSRAPPTLETNTSWLCSRMPACCWSTARIIATRAESTPEVVRRGRSAAVWVTSACTSLSSGRRPSMATATQVPGTGPVAGVEEQPGRVGDRHDALGGEVEAAHLVDRPVAVLHRAQHPQPGGALALEVEHHVDEVLEHPGAGDAAVLGDVADDHQGDVAQLGHPDQRRRDLLDLGDPAGHAVDVAGADGLHRVDDEQGRLDLLHVAEHGAEVGLGREVELVLDARRCGRARIRTWAADSSPVT